MIAVIEGTSIVASGLADTSAPTLAALMVLIQSRRENGTGTTKAPCSGLTSKSARGERHPSRLKHHMMYSCATARSYSAPSPAPAPPRHVSRLPGDVSTKMQLGASEPLSAHERSVRRRGASKPAEAMTTPTAQVTVRPERCPRLVGLRPPTCDPPDSTFGSGGAPFYCDMRVCTSRVNAGDVSCDVLSPKLSPTGQQPHEFAQRIQVLMC